MTQTLQCPNCGAPIDYTPDSEPTVRCSYCDSTVVIPEELRPKSHETAYAFGVSTGLSLEQVNALKKITDQIQAGRKIEAIKVYRQAFGVGLKEAKDAVEAIEAGRPFTIGAKQAETAVKQTTFSIGCFVVGLLILIVIGSIAFFLIPVGALLGLSSAGPIAEVSEKAIAEVVEEIVPTSTTTPAPTPTPAFASELSSFGGEGIGPGKFNDARHVAVDAAGNIYVAEWEEGSRIQKFDASGNFLTLWNATDPNAIVTDVAVDRQGTVYIIQGGRLYRHDGETGEMLGQVEYLDDTRGFENIAATADGGLVAFVRRGFGDDIVRYDAQGNIALTINKAITDQTGDLELNPHLAVDGLGNIYVLGSFHRAVFKYGTDGKYINRFGSDGDGPGQFRLGASGIAVDSQGRIYVAESRRIQVFAPDGRFIDQFEVDGVASGLAISDNDELFIAARTRVIKMGLNER